MEIDPPEFRTHGSWLERLGYKLGQKIVEYRQARRVRHIFEDFEERRKNGELESYFSAKPQLRHFQFIVVGLEELDPQQTMKLGERICDCLLDHGAVLGTITSLWIIAFWGIVWEPDSAVSRLRAVSEILATNGTLTRIAHGQCSSLVGNMGSRYRFSYEGLIPGLQDIREKLSQTEFGTAFEVLEEGPRENK